MANIVQTEALPALDALDQAFKKPIYDAKIADTKFQYYYPSETKNTSCLRWTINHKRGPYVPDVSRMVIAPEIKIINHNKDGPVPKGVQSGPCNNFLHSIFSSLRISYNNVCVCRIDSYGLFSYVRMLLNYNNNDFATWAATRLFCKEGSSQDLGRSSAE